MTGGDKDLKNPRKSNNYLCKIFSFVKFYIKKILSEKTSILSDRRTQNTEASVTLVNEKLNFARYDIIGGVGSRAANGGCNVSSLIKKLHHIAQFMQKLSFLISKLRLRAVNCGSILIEFAVCMPVLIILLFYINDLVKIKRYFSQTEFVAQQAANMIQNISQNREDKAVKLRDLRRISLLAWLSVYPGNTRFQQGSDQIYHF